MLCRCSPALPAARKRKACAGGRFCGGVLLRKHGNQEERGNGAHRGGAVHDAVRESVDGVVVGLYCVVAQDRAGAVSWCGVEEGEGREGKGSFAQKRATERRLPRRRKGMEKKVLSARGYIRGGGWAR